MSECEQTKGQTVLQHGESVKNYLFDLINHMRSNTLLKYEWILPDWFLDNKDLILSSLPDDETLELYTVFHDCGKPFCVETDLDGKRHFPNHAEVSYDYFTRVFNNPIAGELIRRDMDIHLLKSEGVEEFCKNPYALTLLLTGISETHSNANIFGGIESTSFKIKNKNISKRRKQIINNLKNKN
jgi:hypothetical protein